LILLQLQRNKMKAIFFSEILQIVDSCLDISLGKNNEQNQIFKKILL